MAKMHSRNRGHSGSKRPVVKASPEWAAMAADEAVEAVLRLAREGRKPSVIGLTLRDQHGVPSVKALTGKSVVQILEEGKLAAEVPENLMNLIVKAVKVQKHLAENKKDMTSKRGLQLIESKIKRLVDYYKSTGKLSSDWRYTPERAALLVK